MGVFLYRSVVLLTLVPEDSAVGPQQRKSVEALQVDLAASLLCKVPKSVFIYTLLSGSNSCISLRPQGMEFVL